MAQDQEGGLMFNPIEVGTYEEVDEKVNKVLTPGIYSVRIVSATHGQGEKAQYLRWKLEVVDAVDPEDNGFSLWHSTPIEGRGLGILNAFCNAIGRRWQGRQITPEWVESLFGLELNVEISIREYEGRAQNEIKKAIAKVNSL